MFSVPVLNSNQKKCVENARASNKKYGLSFIAADTGTGKTVMTSFIYATDFVEPYKKEFAQWKKSDKQGPPPREPKLVIVSTAGLAMASGGKENEASPWLRELTKYGIRDEERDEKNIVSITYDSLVGSMSSSDNEAVMSGEIIERGTASWFGLKDKNIYDDFRWYEDPKGEDDERTQLYGTLDLEEILDAGIFNRDSVDEEDGEFRPFYCWYGSASEPPFVVRLARELESGGRDRVEDIFVPSMNFMNFCLKYRVMLVFDEFHRAKNETLTNMSCAAMIRAVRRANFMIRGGYDYDLKELTDEKVQDGGRYVMFLSATPLQDQGQAVNYFRLIGYANPLRETDMFVTSHRARTIDMLNEASRFYYDSSSRDHLIKLATKFKFATYSEKKRLFVKLDSFNKAKDKQLKYEIWLAILRKIQFVTTILIVRQAFNYFIPVSDKEGKAYLNEAIKQAKEHRALAEKAPKEAFKMLADIKKNAEAGMVIAMADEVFDGLKKNPRSKHFIAFTRIANIRRFEDRLNTLASEDDSDIGNIGIICGVSAEEKKDLGPAQLKRYTQIAKNETKNAYIKEFMEDNNNMRVLIGTFQKVREGIDLQDTNGNQQRTTWFVGDDDTVSEQQLSGRTARYGMHSVPIINICYPASAGSTLINVYVNNKQRAKNEREVLEVSEEPVSEAEEKLNEEEKERRRAFSKVPGEFNRRFKLNNDQVVALVDSVTADVMTEELIRPTNYLGKNNTKGKEAYKNTEKLLEFLNSKVANLKKGETYDFSKVPGLTVLDIVGGEFDPYPNIE